MIPSSSISKELSRLAAVEEFQAGELKENLNFDRIVHLASKFFDVPIVLVTLVEKDKQIFKAKVGIDLCETSRESSFCAHALDRSNVLVVNDALKDFRFVDNPLVVGEPHIRFYAGAPLIVAGGHVLGAFCLIDTRPRENFTEQNHCDLKDFAKLVLEKIDNRQLKLASAASNSRFENIVESSPDGVIITNSKGEITFWNQASERMFGYSADDIIGSNINLIVPTRFHRKHGDGLKRVAQGGQQRLIGKTVELDAVHMDGSEFPIELSLSMWKETHEPNFGAIIRDISLRKKNAQHMHDLAYLDSLTQVPNRRMLMDEICGLIDNDQPFTLLMLDLDGFKDVNDTLGHQSGDEVLRLIAQRLISNVRTADTVCRLGGDEFAVLLEVDNDKILVDLTAQKILAAMDSLIEIEGRTLNITGSIGAASYPAHGSKVGDLLAAADLAMYQAKAAGKNCLRYFEQAMREVVVERRNAEIEIRRAITQGELELFYQPQVRSADGVLLGVEALIRWRHPTEGLLTPYRFLNAIETGPFAAFVGHWVMHTACTQAVAFRQLVPELVMGVNLFGAQFQTEGLLKDVVDILSETKLPAQALELEINENIILKNDGSILEQLRKIHAMGIGIAFDDFGTGYASLSLLKNYPLTRLKIDRSFVESICTNAADAAIVDAVIYMAKKLQLDVIAEGVENAEQRDFLNSRGCNVVQGYFYGKPMSTPDLEVFLKKYVDRLILGAHNENLIRH
jgi:diguanylate cyclase (GGDEF)-like protein/PAS domain S-box-containing protein